jgi:predicted O-methyltransferase YrrM
MNTKSALTNLATDTTKKAAALIARASQQQHDIDLVLSQTLQQLAAPGDLLFPLECLGLIRDCLKEKRLKTHEIKTESAQKKDLSTLRFSFLIDSLMSLPTLELPVAKELALIADALRGNLSPVEYNEWVDGDVRSHFERRAGGAPSGTRARILNTIVRFCQARQCLELGTNYGMSALAILQTLKSRGKDANLTTVEGWEPQFSISSKILNTRYGDRVTCVFGLTQDVLPTMAKSAKRFDFLFHDAGHSKEDYVRDFQLALPILAAGATVLVDDIRWKNAHDSSVDPGCYEGWMELVNSPRVRRAVEISDSMGLLLLSE